MPNRLALEQSPYLLQHAHNPVDWYPWGDEAFARARAEHKPIFLSVGYSTCHWCHVMEHESFEDAELAAQLNRDFVAIKVDREERPDVDRVYMTFVQATTGSGGWPMSVWLTPDLKPFYGGTYFPPRSKWGRPGFAEVLAELAKAWREDGERVTRSAESLAAQLASLAGTAARGPVPDPRVLDQTTREFAATFDARRGGFGQAPKFPRPSELLFLLRQFARTGERPTLSMVERTLQAMAIGGMRDQIGGGFHRYSVDADWRVPHFEKMLYDQAQLVLAYLEAYQASGSVAFADVAADTIAYVLRDLRDPGGGFYSAEDADSDAQGRLKPAPTSDEGQPVQVARERGVRLEPAPTSSVHKTEGAFYLWTHEEVDAVAGADADLVRARFGIEHGGNAPFDPHEEFGRGNIPFVAKGLDELAASFDTDVATAALRIDAARHAMFVARAARPRPHLDDKILTSWNGLMMAALARAARVLRRPDWLDAATAAASFLRAHLWNDATRTLLRRHRAGQSAIPGFVDDYANLVWGLLELFQAGGDPQWLAWAIALQRRQDELFGDTIAGGWFSTTGDDPSVLFRSKDDYDGAEPAATSVGAWNVLVLAHLTGDSDWQARTEDAFVSCARRIESGGRAMPLLLCALSAWHAGVQQCAIVGADDDAGTETLWRTASAHYLPFAVFLPIDPALQAALAEVLPSAAAFRQIDSRPTAYWCRNFACDAPTTDADALDRLLG